MGLFGKRKVAVTVHGNTTLDGGADGRYDKQARKNRKADKKRIKELALVPRTTKELTAYIESTYQVKELPEDDEIVKSVLAKMSDWGAVSLHCYNIVVMQGTQPAAWLEVYVEDFHNYLAFRIVELECDDKYSVNRAISDIVRYFGAGKDDKKAKNERYIQFINMA